MTRTGDGASAESLHNQEKNKLIMQASGLSLKGKSGSSR